MLAKLFKTALTQHRSELSVHVSDERESFKFNFGSRALKVSCFTLLNVTEVQEKYL